MKNRQIPSSKRSHLVCGFPQLTSFRKALRALPVLTTILLLGNIGTLRAADVPFFLEDFEDGNAADGLATST